MAGRKVESRTPHSYTSGSLLGIGSAECLPLRADAVDVQVNVRWAPRTACTRAGSCGGPEGLEAVSKSETPRPGAPMAGSLGHRWRDSRHQRRGLNRVWGSCTPTVPPHMAPERTQGFCPPGTRDSKGGKSAGCGYFGRVSMRTGGYRLTGCLVH